MKVASDGNLGLSREYLKKLFGPVLFMVELSFNEQQGLSQDLETGCLNLAILKFWGALFFKGYHNILKLQP